MSHPPSYYDYHCDYDDDDNQARVRRGLGFECDSKPNS